MAGKLLWRRYLHQAVVESSAVGRNWRWMLASLGIGAGLGLVAGLQRLGAEPARLSGDVVMATIRAAVIVFVVAWVAAVGVRFGRRLRS